MKKEQINREDSNRDFWYIIAFIQNIYHLTIFTKKAKYFMILLFVMFSTL